MLPIKQIDRSAIKYYKDTYVLLVSGMLGQKRDTYLGNENNKVCRFCGQKEGTVKFEHRAHVFPESIGNRHLLSYYECDTCNMKFSRMLENHYSNFFKFYHNASNIHGKKTVPTYKSGLGRSKAEWKKDIYGNEMYIVSDYADDITTFINFQKKTITRRGVIDSYIPMAVYKCFVKMALAVLPESELGKFVDTIRWIQEKTHRNIFNSKRLLCRCKMIPGYNIIKFPIFCLYKRKKQLNGGLLFEPYMLFLLIYGNFSYLIEVPTKDEKSFIDITRIPFPPIPFKTEGEMIYDFSGGELCKNHVCSMEYHFDDIYPIVNNKEPNMNEETLLKIIQIK